MADASACLEQSNGESTHIYGYNNEHDVYMVVKDTQWECEQPSYNLKKSQFWSFTLKRNPGVFELKQGLQHF